MIRPLLSSELDLCLRGGELFFDEGQLPGGFKPEVFKAKIGAMIDSGTAVVLGCFDRDGTIQGALAAVIYDDIYNGDKTATELWWFVLPEHRGGSAAMRLIRSFEKWASENGCTRCCMIHLAALQPARLSVVYESMGYRLLETCYAKSLSG